MFFRNFRPLAAEACALRWNRRTDGLGGWLTRTAPPCASVRCVRPPAGCPRPSSTAGSAPPAVTATMCSATALSARGASFPELDNDPDRLQAPLIRRNGELVEVGWDERCEPRSTDCGNYYSQHRQDRRLPQWPNAHTVSGGLYSPQLQIAGPLKVRLVFSASTLGPDAQAGGVRMPLRQPFAFTVPDLDRTDHTVIIGANPLVVQRQCRHRRRFPRQAQGAAPRRVG